ncbi:MAG: hypothetical protein OEX11_03820 [Nitrosomonas sp.]|nr:hypothetical protein [Nitrosomonas sp.]
MVQLPGGVYIDGSLKRDFNFKPITGLLELELNECATQVSQHPELTYSEQVTNVLCQALDLLAGKKVTKKRVKELSVGDRQFLMRHLAIHIDNALVWMSAKCGECSESFDISLRYSELPVKPAGNKFPETIIETELGKLKVRVPNGLDQEFVATVDNDEEATVILLKRLVSHAANKSTDAVVDISSLKKEQIALIEEAIEQMAPEVATEVLAECPHCDTGNRVPVNPYVCMERSDQNLFTEVHTLASCYHWNEHEILAMTRRRRHIYLGLIDRGRNMASNNNI